MDYINIIFDLEETGYPVFMYVISLYKLASTMYSIQTQFQSIPLFPTPTILMRIFEQIVMSCKSN